MFNKTMMALAGSAAMVIVAPAVAAPGGHGGGQGGAGGASAASVHGNAGMNATIHAPSSTTLNSNGAVALEHSQGPYHASPSGIAHANQNSVLARGAVDATTLSGLTTTLPVQTSGGTSLGTVTKIIYGPNNTTIRAIVVTSSTGKTYTLPASTLSISGGVVTTTSTNVG